MSKAEIVRAARAERERRQISLFEQKIRKKEVARRNKVEVAARAERTAAKRQEKEDRRLLFEQREYLRLNEPETLARQYEEMSAMAKRQYELFRDDHRRALALADKVEETQTERTRVDEARKSWYSLQRCAVRYRKLADEHFDREVENLAKEAFVAPQ